MALLVLPEDHQLAPSVESPLVDKGIFLSKWKYVIDLLKETGIHSCKVVDNPVN
jgi:hypothetical protein